jgi:hypothetical protein
VPTGPGRSLSSPAVPPQHQPTQELPSAPDDSMLVNPGDFLPIEELMPEGSWT